MRVEYQYRVEQFNTNSDPKNLEKCLNVLAEQGFRLQATKFNHMYSSYEDDYEFEDDKDKHVTKVDLYIFEKRHELDV